MKDVTHVISYIQTNVRREYTYHGIESEPVAYLFAYIDQIVVKYIDYEAGHYSFKSFEIISYILPWICSKRN